MSDYKVKFFDPGRWFENHEDEMMVEIRRVLRAGDLILRKDVEIFEENLAKYVGTKYAIGLNSGTDALYLALRYLKIGRGDEVLVPSYTFVSTVQVVKQLKAIPVQYDLDSSLEELPKVQFKAFICAHLEGSRDRGFSGLLHRVYQGTPLIEDACQALGAIKNPTSFAQAWSFYPAKILGAYGDAGALTMNDENLYNWVKEARNHFKNTNEDWGINSRMDNLQAAILNVKFKYLPEVLAARQGIASHYSEGLDTIKELILPVHSEGRVWQDYVIRTIFRDKLYEFLKEKGIETLKNNYPFPIKKLLFAQTYEDETLRLPCNETLTKSEIDYVIKSIHEFY